MFRTKVGYSQNADACSNGAESAAMAQLADAEAVDDPELITVVQIAPAVRSAYGEMIGLPDELATEKRMAAAVRALGEDYVFDTNYTADLTIMALYSEYLEKPLSHLSHLGFLFASRS